VVWDTIGRFIRPIIVFAALVAQMGGWLVQPYQICDLRAG